MYLGGLLETLAVKCGAKSTTPD